jgi:phosphoribosylglycinamide formyltransferase 1
MTPPPSFPRREDVAEGSAGVRPARLLVLISGGGRTMLNLLDRIAAGTLRAQVPLVVASRECAGAERARARGVEVRVIPGNIPAQALESLVREFAIDYVVLAGYLKLVPVPASLERRIINIHPALLPKFGGPGMYGHHVHEAVLAAGDAESGCTVHFCDAHYDQGPILLQRRCPVLPGDTPDTLAARVFEEELKALPEALDALIQQQLGRPPRHVPSR